MKDAVTSRKPKGAKADASPRTSAADEPVVIGVPHRRLGRTLRELRQETGLPIATAAKAVRMSPSALQRLEAGEATKIEDEKLTKLCRLYKAMDKLPDLKTLAAQRKEQSWWDENTDMLAPSFKVYLGLEAEANHLTVYRPDIVSSLFQTDEYAQVLDRSSFPADDTDQEQRNAVRRRRQNLITRSLAPIEVDLVLDEGVLRRVVGNHQVMGRQLRHLADLPANVRVRVLPDSAGYPLGKAVTAYTLLEFGDEKQPPVVYAESYAGSMHLETPRTVKAYRDAFRVIQRVAWDTVETKRHLRRLAKEYAL